MARQTLLAACAVAMLASAANAQEITIGWGKNDFHRKTAEDGGFGTLEYHHKPFANWAGFDFALGAGIYWDSADDLFIGAGLVVTRMLGDSDWFIQFSEMPGYYDAGSRPNDLGHHLEFHSQLALGYRFSETRAASLAVSHMSNASIGDENPGVNMLQLRYHQRF